MAYVARTALLNCAAVDQDILAGRNRVNQRLGIDLCPGAMPNQPKAAWPKLFAQPAILARPNPDQQN